MGVDGERFRVLRVHDEGPAVSGADARPPHGLRQPGCLPARFIRFAACRTLQAAAIKRGVRGLPEVGQWDYRD